MSFLRKWGSSGNAATGPAGAGQGGPAGANGANGLPKREWYAEMPGERYYGMENFGNTCYANSVLQALYFCLPFRLLVLSYAAQLDERPHARPSVSSMSSAASSSRADTDLSRSVQSPSGMTQPLSPNRPPSAGLAGEPASPSLSASGSSRQWGGSMRRPTTSGSGRNNSLGTGVPQQLGTSPTASDQLLASMQGPEQTTITVGPSSPPPASLLDTLIDLFRTVTSQPNATGTVAPQAFIAQLRKENEFFRSTLHQDAHEFLNWLLNSVAESIERADATARARSSSKPTPLSRLGGDGRTFIHSLFEGVITNEVRCLTCETVSSRDEAFLDLSIDIEPNASVTACLRQFSASEMLCQRNKFLCERCCGLQEAEKRMKIKKLPNVLALHLKRFKYEESLQRHIKLAYRVPFPFELRLFNTTESAANPDRLYKLWAIVVHLGVGPHHGHYIAIIKSGSRWVMFDDNTVSPIEEDELSRFFGDTPGQGSGYVLFYQADDLDVRRLEDAGEAAQAGVPLEVVADPSGDAERPQVVGGIDPHVRVPLPDTWPPPLTVNGHSGASGVPRSPIALPRSPRTQDGVWSSSPENSVVGGEQAPNAVRPPPSEDGSTSTHSGAPTTPSASLGLTGLPPSSSSAAPSSVGVPSSSQPVSSSASSMGGGARGRRLSYTSSAGGGGLSEQVNGQSNTPSVSSSAGTPSGGAFAATRNFLSRRASRQASSSGTGQASRPMSMHGVSSNSSTTPQATAPTSPRITSNGSMQHLGASPQLHPSSSATAGSGAVHMRAASAPGPSSSRDTQPPPARDSSTLSRKELEKRMKAERKEQERRDKELAKRDKDEAKARAKRERESSSATGAGAPPPKPRRGLSMSLGLGSSK